VKRSPPSTDSHSCRQEQEQAHGVPSSSHWAGDTARRCADSWGSRCARAPSCFLLLSSCEQRRFSQYACQKLTWTSISVVGAVCVVYIPWYYKNVIIKPYHNFPEPVAKKLRKALFYSRGKWLDIREANKYFRQALAAAEEEGMDPFSDEIMGVKYTIAALFEDAGYYSLAVDVLEIMRSDCTKWVDEFSDRHWNDGDRSRVMKNLVQINLKLGQLYDVKYVNEPENGGKRLTEAVESALKEQQRRDKEGLKPGEGEWLTSDEMGGALEGKSSCVHARRASPLTATSTRCAL
jgi:hypothetical protein